VKSSSDPPPRAPELADLDFDPDASLLRQPDVLLDPSFLGALHADFERELGASGARIALLQIGLLQGLRDAFRVTADAFATHFGQAGSQLIPPLLIRYRTHRCPAAPGALEIRGSWPEQREARARLSHLGTSSEPSCALSAGYTSGWLSGTLDANMLALETRCSAAGEEACVFVAREAEVWRAAGDRGAEALLDALPFEAFRELVRAGCHESAGREPSRFDPEAAVVHIWGPVMVIPFAGADEALRAVELIGRDPGARKVSVVVLDLTGAVVDDAFGALALEQIVENAEALGAETIFAGLSPLSEGVVARLERQPLLIQKDVEQAIATAFQISEAQRRCV
jgi:anti-anti-sigma regulatory factor